MKSLFIASLALFFCARSFSQKVMPLYDGDIPNSTNVADEEKNDTANMVVSKVSRPTLTVYLPAKEKATGAAVVICPGGGYGVLVIGKEGYHIAEYLAANGIAAVVLKYRLPDDKFMKDKAIGPLQDAQQAIRQVKLHAKEWNIDSSRVGIMGFSAGGHLASTEGTHYDKVLVPNNENISVRPSFMILVYPVISMNDTLGHRGSRDNLLGKNPSKEKINLYSNDLQVNAQTPPTFLFHTGDDRVVDVDNSIYFYEALRHNKVPAEMHLYPKGDHGFVLNWPVEQWMRQCLDWMKAGNL
ncbi:alpha/beta hydrolase [Danxiaibacter flavus]|uniref:Alpha/beta hydrolase n=1 Tax=Danxiaibacter flavus TaxID=3049108 RepID=A0ABV3ZCN4_9BACT|nr:alpha/beta hydrolase [Chitinophagaceae bacterium DXS]